MIWYRAYPFVLFSCDLISLNLYWLYFFSVTPQAHLCFSVATQMLPSPEVQCTHTSSPLYFFLRSTCHHLILYIFSLKKKFPSSRMSALCGFFTCFLMYPQSLEQHLVLGSCSINVCCINEWIHYYHGTAYGSPSLHKPKLPYLLNGQLYLIYRMIGTVKITVTYSVVLISYEVLIVLPPSGSAGREQGLSLDRGKLFYYSPSLPFSATGHP